jgi:hypothetical protein
MKVRVIEGDEAILSATAYGRRSRESIDRGIDRLRRFSRNLRDGVLDKVDRIETSIRRYLDDDIGRAVREVNKRKKRGYRDDIIMFLAEREDIADAPPRMRRWALSNPRLASLFRQQRLDGWGASPDFLDVAPGERDPYYVATRNGVVERDEQSGLFYSDYSYGDCTVDGEYLHADEQLDVIATHDVIDDLLDQNIDPTSPLGESL